MHPARSPLETIIAQIYSKFTIVQRECHRKDTMLHGMSQYIKAMQQRNCKLDEKLRVVEAQVGKPADVKAQSYWARILHLQNETYQIIQIKQDGLGPNSYEGVFGPSLSMSCTLALSQQPIFGQRL
ncbi:hypothetical protein N7516_000645 [Penicillium verrucosum]|uniref:uncharacterized protein n=1 Tax=Penicillium verrucosum TaxID=60171 RepID=UPI0025458054|nr:uncharacterized protein N7516_000645 [Penicillium verrucosum]KAJ5940477.1 hypothetical protein N7516_000645 [Penicillium verrucosum]